MACAKDAEKRASSDENYYGYRIWQIVLMKVEAMKREVPWRLEKRITCTFPKI